MNSKKKLLKRSRLYAIINNKFPGNNSFLREAQKAVNSGVEVIQYRDKICSKEKILKNVTKLKKILKNKKVILIINDHLDIARLTNADGLHLGQDDTPIAIARKELGKKKIIGISCHSLKDAISAFKSGADYIGLGPIFKTPTKAKLHPIGTGIIAGVKKRISIPYFCIGGIDDKNLKKLLDSGAERFAFVRAVKKIKKLNSIINNHNIRNTK